MSAVVIGAAGTIGTACVEQLVRDGHDVFAADLAEPAIVGATGVSLDVTDRHAVEETMTRLDAAAPITALIYAAGLNTTGPVDAIDWSRYDQVMAVNLQGAFHVGAVLESLMRTRQRTLGAVFVASTAGLVGEAGGSVYCASKFGLLGFTQSFAAEIAPLGGRANAVCPGNVDSPMLTALAEQIGAREGRESSAVLDELAHSCAFARLITPAEVARTCAWLVSDGASGISGQTIVVDGPPA
jgi:NAD(P)-dependent dehydrogenase (short-subunit alcohol dehydrogenase family)